MPVRQEVDAERGRIVATVAGEVTIDEIVSAIDESVSDPTFLPGFDIYSDHLQIEKVITPQQLKAMLAHLKSIASRISGARWAIVTHEPASYGMMRMLSVHAEEVPLDVRVFATPDEADQWLASPRC